MLFLVFEAGPHRFALAASRVAEVVPRVKLRPLPGAPPHVAGLLNHAGRLVPVVDLERLVAGEVSPDRLSSRIILVDRPMNGTRLGLIAAHVDRLREHESPATDPSQTGRLGAILQWEDDLAVILDVERIAEEDVGAELFRSLPEESR